jgi:hypothetical protein
MPYYDDDGNELDPESIVKPALCHLCAKNNIEEEFPDEEILCNLTRLDQAGDVEFKCGGFELNSIMKN